MVEAQPSKLNVASSNLVSRSESIQSRQAEKKKTFAHLAQQVERVLGKDEVTSSSLVVGSKIRNPTSTSENHGKGEPTGTTIRKRR